MLGKCMNCAAKADADMFWVDGIAEFFADIPSEKVRKIDLFPNFVLTIGSHHQLLVVF